MVHNFNLYLPTSLRSTLKQIVCSLTAKTLHILAHINGSILQKLLIITNYSKWPNQSSLEIKIAKVWVKCYNQKTSFKVDLEIAIFYQLQPESSKNILSQSTDFLFWKRTLHISMELDCLSKACGERFFWMRAFQLIETEVFVQHNPITMKFG